MQEFKTPDCSDKAVCLDIAAVKDQKEPERCVQVSKQPFGAAFHL